MSKTTPTNQEIADLLNRIADLLENRDENPFRVRAYRSGATSLQAADQRVADLVSKGKTDELDNLPNIGSGLTGLISEYVTTGHSNLLNQLEAKTMPEDAFTRVPGIGPELAERIADKLHIETLEELEQAAHDGRLETVEGFGARRVESVRTSLAGLLGRSASRRSMVTANESKHEAEPAVDLLFEIDDEYRRRAEAGDLKKIAPKRFNPDQKAWLPVMDKKRDGWTFTVLFSNTARAHELEKTDDWVVIYFVRGGNEGQRTVVTATNGPLKGKRVVRGREQDSQQYYEDAPESREKAGA
jgi:DNA polymerase (family X)